MKRGKWIHMKQAERLRNDAIHFFDAASRVSERKHFGRKINGLLVQCVCTAWFLPKALRLVGSYTKKAVDRCCIHADYIVNRSVFWKTTSAQPKKWEEKRGRKTTPGRKPNQLYKTQSEVGHTVWPVNKVLKINGSYGQNKKYFLHKKKLHTDACLDVRWMHTLQDGHKSTRTEKFGPNQTILSGSGCSWPRSLGPHLHFELVSVMRETKKIWTNSDVRSHPCRTVFSVQYEIPRAIK